MTYLHGKFVWFEHVSADSAAAKHFYAPLFGWKIESVDMGGQPYLMINNGTESIGGLRDAPKGMPSAWMSYMSVADVDAGAKAAQEAGAKVLMPPTDFPPVGRGATLMDPTGGVFSIWKSAQGDAPDAEKPPIGGWYWNELWTGDDAKARAFYEKVFGYSYDTMDMGPQGTYYLLMKDGKPRGGLMKSSQPGAPTMWLPYVLVAQCDATLAKAKQLGAKERVPATDIPKVGRFAVVSDPTGAAIAFMTSVEM
jgi:predicted enzyme related to lactoylglutathione lyase